MDNGFRRDSGSKMYDMRGQTGLTVEGIHYYNCTVLLPET